MNLSEGNTVLAPLQMADAGQLCSPNVMESLKALGIAGFLFFLIKGLVWLVLFALVARGVVPKDKVDAFRRKFRLRRRKD